jgi:hypothetical protein
MLNPYIIFKPEYVSRLRTLKKRYLVSQDLPVYYGGAGKKKILVTDYGDIGLAEMHYKAVKDHHYAAIIDLENSRHQERLKELFIDDTVELWWTVVEQRESLKKKVDKKYKENIRRYILKNTDWKISGKDSLTSTLQFIFGQFYIMLQWGKQAIRVKFEEIELS